MTAMGSVGLSAHLTVQRSGGLSLRSSDCQLALVFGQKPSPRGQPRSKSRTASSRNVALRAGFFFHLCCVAVCLSACPSSRCSCDTCYCGCGVVGGSTTTCHPGKPQRRQGALLIHPAAGGTEMRSSCGNGRAGGRVERLRVGLGSAMCGVWCNKRTLINTDVSSRTAFSIINSSRRTAPAWRVSTAAPRPRPCRWRPQTRRRPRRRQTATISSAWPPPQERQQEQGRGRRRGQVSWRKARRRRHRRTAHPSSTLVRALALLLLLVLVPALLAVPPLVQPRPLLLRQVSLPRRRRRPQQRPSSWGLAGFYLPPRHRHRHCCCWRRRPAWRHARAARCCRRPPPSPRRR